MNSKALDVFGCELDGTRLIEASAGTGKTWNICALVLRLLLERRLELQQVLVVTFTRSATAELKDRIRARIVETLEHLRGLAPAGGDPFVGRLLGSLRERSGARDEEWVLRLEAALRNFDEASIFTIHSFCERALADSPFSSGVPLAMQPAAEASDLRKQFVFDLWRRHVANGSQAPALVGYLLASADNPDKWDALLERRLKKPLSRLVWPAGLDDSSSADEHTLAAAFDAARQTWNQDRNTIVATVSQAMPRLHAGIYKPESLQAAAEGWDALLATPDPLAVSVLPKALHLLGTRSLQPKKGREPVAPHAFFAQAQLLLDCLDARRRGLEHTRLRLLRKLLEEGPGELGRLKREHRVVSFEDMLSNLHEALTGGQRPWLAQALRTRFAAALIDEFQDTDPLQFDIFRSIYAGSECPLFLVGDPKQAIYGFRSADLHTYLQARDQAREQYTLSDNQRSTQPLLEALNGLFSRNPQAFLMPGLDYQPVGLGDKPRPAWHDGSEPRAPLQLWELPFEDQLGPMSTDRARRAAVQACASEIARLLFSARRGEIRIDDRALEGRDIAVLVRSHSHGAQIRQALSALGVASVEHSQASIFKSPDAQDLKRLLAAVHEPTQAGLMRAALATGILGWDASRIDALSAQEGRELEWVARFGRYRELWRRQGVGTMLRTLMEEEQVHARLLARPDGERRMTNLLHLFELLHQASEAHGAPTLLLRWLDAQFEADGSDDAAQLRLESDRNLVQIVTIHRCKGLEYPVVFCPALWGGQGKTQSAGSGAVEYHDAEGHPVLDFSDEGRTKAVKASLQLGRAAEDMRLVYVALTRAVHRCYLVVDPHHRGKQKDPRAGGCTLLNYLAAGGGFTWANWKTTDKKSPNQDGGQTAQAIRMAWQALSIAQPAAVGWSRIPIGHGMQAKVLAGEDEGSPTALAPPARIPSARWIGSFSALSRGARHEDAARDHDERTETRSDELGEGRQAHGTPDVPEDDILNFPRGAWAGECIHAVFERADFTDRSTWPQAIEGALRDFPQASLYPDEARRLPQMLANMLEDVLDSPLQGDMRLSTVALTRRLVEFEFHLPAARLTSADLQALMGEYDYPAPTHLTFSVLEGHLKGFVDLLFEHQGRFYVLDWKSNFLGLRAQDHSHARIAHTMRKGTYHLQYLLYTVAVHRFLQRRLPGYSYDKHFGGVLYLFVRGVRPTWKQADGQACGVHFDRPCERLVERLSALCTAPTTLEESA